MEATAPLLPTPDQDGKKLRRELTLLDSLSIVVGIIVGSGIFTTPGVVLAQAGSVGEGLIMWLVAGGLTLCSALLYAELGTSIPVSSGDVEFLRTAFGPSWAFSFIWTSFLVLFPGSINIFAISLGQYFLAAVRMLLSARASFLSWEWLGILDIYPQPVGLAFHSAPQFLVLWLGVIVVPNQDTATVHILNLCTDLTSKQLGEGGCALVFVDFSL